MNVFKFLIGVRWILAGLIYIWTIYIAYVISGIFAAVVTLFLPFIGQVYWGYQAWKSSGFDSPYIQWLIVLIALWIIQKLIYWIVLLVEEKKNKIST